MMAGYDADFEFDKRSEEGVKKLLRVFSRLGKEHGLDIHYKVLSKDNLYDTCEFTVDGHLEDIQVFAIDFSSVVEGKYRFETLAGNKRKEKKYIRDIFLPIAKVNNEAVNGITAQIENTAKLSQGVTVGAVAKSKIRNELRRLEGNPILKMIQVWEGARQKLLSGLIFDSEMAIGQTILLDQAIEAYLKSRLGISYKIDFPNLTNIAVTARTIGTDEKTELDRFHTKRNKSQHQNEPVTEDDLYNYLVFLSRVINRLLVDGSGLVK